MNIEFDLLKDSHIYITIPSELKGTPKLSTT